MAGAATTQWFVKPVDYFAIGIGLGAAAWLFEFWNLENNQIYSMQFVGLGMAGARLPGKGAGQLSQWKAIFSGRPKGGNLTGDWYPLSTNNAFSGPDLDNCSGRAEILGASLMGIGGYICLISAGRIGKNYFGGAKVDVIPNEIGGWKASAIVGLWGLVSQREQTDTMTPAPLEF